MDNQTPPPAPHIPPNHSNYQPEQELLRLRRRLGDLLRLGALTPDTFQQAVFQLFQESERRRLSALQEAEDHLRKYHALLSQAGAFAAQGSIIFAVINGFATLEERRLQETAERAREQAEKERATPPLVPAPIPVLTPAPPPDPPAETPSIGHSAQEVVGSSDSKKTSGGRRKKP